MRDRRIAQLAEDEYRPSGEELADSNELVKPETNLRVRYDVYPMVWINTHKVLHFWSSVVGSNCVLLHPSDFTFKAR